MRMSDIFYAANVACLLLNPSLISNKTMFYFALLTYDAKSGRFIVSSCTAIQSYIFHIFLLPCLGSPVLELFSRTRTEQQQQ